MNKKQILVVAALASNLVLSFNSFASTPSSVASAQLMTSTASLLASPYLSGSSPSFSASDPSEDSVVQAAANDAADFINGAEPTALLSGLEASMRLALVKGGNQHSYSDTDLARMIMSQADY
jgi:hypothetical protein